MKPAGHTPDHHHSHHRRLSQVCMPRVGMAQIGWGLPRFDEWIERCRAARDHLLASPRFRRWAAGFPLTRPIARKRSRELFDLCAGFVYSQVLLACVRLRLFEIVADGPRTVGRTRPPSGPAGGSPRSACCAPPCRCVCWKSAAMTASGWGRWARRWWTIPAVASMVEHHTMLYADMRDPVALLRGGMRTELSQYWPYAAAERPAALATEQVAAYTRADGGVPADGRGGSACGLSAAPASPAAGCRRRRRHFPDPCRRNARRTCSVMLFDLPAVAQAATDAFRGPPVWSRAPRPSAVTSCRTRCRSGRISSRWSGSSTTMTTMRP